MLKLLSRARIGAAAMAVLLVPAIPWAQDVSDTPVAASDLTASTGGAARSAAASPILEIRPSPPQPPAHAPPGARLAPGTPIPPAELEAFVDGVVGQALAGDHVPGVAVSVVQNGQVLLKKGYGFASLSPGRAVDPDRTLFRIGSISKIFTWTLVMREVERGRMRLDAPINLYLPEVLQVRDQGFARQVLAADLMTHAEGFEDRSLGRLFERDPNRVRPLAVYLRQEKPRRVRPAGVMPEYSNYGAALAGAAVGEIEGRSFEELTESQILRPLGLWRTTFREPYPRDPALPAPMNPALAADLAQGFRWTGAAFEARPFEYISQIAPAGSASSTAGDMARLMLLILNGGALDGATLYGPQTAQAFRTVLLRSAPGVNGWAHGFMQRRLPGGFEAFGHTGETLSFRSSLLTVPALNLGVFVAGNSATAGRLAERLPDLIAARFYAPPPTPPATGAPDLLRRAAAFSGDYVTEKRRSGGLEKFVSLLIGGVRVDVTPTGQLVVHDFGGGGAWTPDGPLGQFRSLDGDQPSAFQMNDGAAVRWFAPSGTQSYVRVGPFLQVGTLSLLTLACLAAAGATLLGLATRDRRDFRQTSIQGRASGLQTATSVLWFAAVGAFGVWGVGARADYAKAFYGWPSPLVTVASASALVAAACSLILLTTLPVIWRGGRRLDSWTAGRKLRFTLTTLVFLTYAGVLMLWGGLEPWNS